MTSPPDAPREEASAPRANVGDCLEPDEIAGLLEGFLVGAELGRVEAHIDRCPDCRRCLSALTKAGPDEPSPGAEATTRPPPGGAARAADLPSTDEPSLERGAALGRYVVDGVLGTGAMGVVYAAYDPELDRKVALKLLRAAPREGAGGRAQLLREARAMARLAHPNVVAVHDVGEHGGQPFLAMEFVEGITLRSWLRREARPAHEVLGAVVQAGRGLAAAHAAGVVHRDFKPDNVLCDRAGRVRVTDFGLAHAALAPEPRATSTGGPASPDDRIRATLAGSIVGTPAYMAPEQLRGGAADAASDQFSFCVVLYEALYRQRPFAGATFTALAEAVTGGQRREPPANARVSSALHKVVARGLSVEPGRRFASMAELLTAIADETRSRRRRRVAGAGLAGVALGLVALPVGYRAARPAAPSCQGAERKLAGAWDAPRREAVRSALLATGKPFASDAWRGVERSLDAYARAWTAARVDACEATHVRGEQSAELLDLRMTCLDERLRDVASLTEVLARLDADVVTKAIDAVQALPPVAPCADGQALRARVKPPSDAATAAKVEALRGELGRANALGRAGLYREALSVAERAAQEAPALGYRPVLAEALFRHGSLQGIMGQMRESEATLGRAIAAADAAGDDQVRAEAWVRLIYASNSLAKYDAVAFFNDQARAALERLGGNAPVDAGRRFYFANTLMRQGKLDEALPEYEGAVALSEKTFGPQSNEVAACLNGLGTLQAARGDYAAALASLHRALAIGEATAGPLHPRLAPLLNSLGELHLGQLRYAEAAAHYERGLALIEGSLGPNAGTLWQYLNNLGNALHEQGLDEPALGHLERALALAEKQLGHTYARLVYPLAALGEVNLALGKRQPALDHLERAAQLRVESFDAKELARAQFALARALETSTRDRPRARSLAASARDTYRASGKSPLEARNRRLVEQWLEQHPG